MNPKSQIYTVKIFNANQSISSPATEYANNRIEASKHAQFGNSSNFHLMHSIFTNIHIKSPTWYNLYLGSSILDKNKFLMWY